MKPDYEKAGQLHEELKRLAREYNVAVVFPPQAPVAGEPIHTWPERQGVFILDPVDLLPVDEDLRLRGMNSKQLLEWVGLSLEGITKVSSTHEKVCQLLKSLQYMTEYLKRQKEASDRGDEKIPE